ncbi:sensor histidine kinase [Nonomuraea sp. LPB2021202275-12-8]|uniref:sensor histidine kinase n=1 Tax=Nonomuraea sp. LPB2021202275-12-8 TaxID=3120159 RepID=UPI00300C32B4
MWMNRLWLQLGSVDPRIVDGALAVTFTLTSAAWAWTEQQPDTRPPDTGALLLIAAANLPLTFRRRWPLAVVVVCCVAGLIYHAMGYHPGQNSLSSLVALYSVAVHRPLRYCLAASVLTTCAWAYATAMQTPWAALWSVLARALVVCGFVVVFGLVVRLLAQRNRRQAELTGRLRELTHKLRLERDSTAKLAAARERVRIARELHDVVAHHLSVISIQAELGQYVLTTDPATVGTALATISDTSREALGEMQRLLSILRIGTDDSTPAAYDAAPGLQDLAALMERVGTAGVSAEMTVIGDPKPLPPGLELCLYRIIQEGLTNVLKHAAPTQVQILIGYASDAVTVQIIDAGPKRCEPVTETPVIPGHGLLGISERVKLYQGTMSAGPSPEGGFRVTACVPLQTPHPGD